MTRSKGQPRQLQARRENRTSFDVPRDVTDLLLIILAALLGPAFFLQLEHEVAGKWGFPLDDSWIYATFARNLATGHGYSFNPGEVTGGATGPLYVFILALLYWLFHDVVWTAKILGMACFAASSVLVYKSAKLAGFNNRAVPLFAGLIVALSPPLVWGALSGMELPVYLLAACLGIYYYAKERWTATAAAWSIGVWLRPDGLLLALLGLIARPRVTLRNILRPTIVTVAIIGSFGLFNYAVGGSLLPNSVGVKSSLGGDIIAREWSMAAQWLWLWGLSIRSGRVGLHFALLISAIVVGAIASFRRWPAFAVYALGFSSLFALFGPSGGQHGRYIAYVIPFGAILGCLGLAVFASRLPGRSQARWLVVLGMLCLGWQVYTGRLMRIAYGWNVQNINNMQVFMAERIRLGVTPGDTLAVNDVGAMGYFSGCYVVDLIGLVSPKRDLPENLTIYRPKFMAIFPDWFGKYVRFDPKTGFPNFYSSDSLYKYAPLVRIGLRHNTISARNTMVLFERLRPEEEAATEAPAYVR